MSDHSGIIKPDGMLADMLAIQNPSRDDLNWPLPSFDAHDWAAAFCETLAKSGHPGIDEEWMISWFGMALMRGFDEAQMRKSSTEANQI